jgi:hypothetical protein
LLVTDKLRSYAAAFGPLPVHQPQRRPTVPPTRDQHVKHLAFVIARPPEIHRLASDPKNDVVKVPVIARPRTAPAQPSRDRGAEL